MCIATCQAGLETVLANEIKNLGIKTVEQGKRQVSFQASLRDIYLCNMALRTAINVLIPVKHFIAHDYDILYYKSRTVNWHELFDVNRSIRIDVKGQSEVLQNSEFTIHRVKDAIADTFKKFASGQRPSVNKNDPDIHVVVYLKKREVTLYLDSSGSPLFKRGYRQIHGVAPLKEDLAAGILMLSDWNGNSNLLDPMCGSGTFLFEAYMIATKTAPNLNRKFAFMNWKNFAETEYEKVKQKLTAQITPTETKIIGVEIDRPTYAKARKIIRNSFPKSGIKVINGDFRDITENYHDFFIISNPPYGERIKIKQDLIALYAELGDFLKQKCKGGKAAIFTANMEAGKRIGLKPSARIKLYNGPMEARLYKFDLY